MGKSKKPHWNELNDIGKEKKQLHLLQGPLDEQDIYASDDDWQDRSDLESALEEDEWEESDAMEMEISQHYFNDAHEALSKLTQKSNKRALHQAKKPKRAESWN